MELSQHGNSMISSQYHTLLTSQWLVSVYTFIKCMQAFIVHLSLNFYEVVLMNDTQSPTSPAVSPSHLQLRDNPAKYIQKLTWP